MRSFRCVKNLNTIKGKQSHPWEKSMLSVQAFKTWHQQLRSLQHSIDWRASDMSAALEELPRSCKTQSTGHKVSLHLSLRPEDAFFWELFEILKHSQGYGFIQGYEFIRKIPSKYCSFEKELLYSFFILFVEKVCEQQASALKPLARGTRVTLSELEKGSWQKKKHDALWFSLFIFL